MKSNEIKEAALKFFTIHGYEGASLSLIAEEVGMKKQSIYAHFKGKDDLFCKFYVMRKRRSYLRNSNISVKSIQKILKKIYMDSCNWSSIFSKKMSI